LENGLLALDTDVFWPFDEAGQVTLWLDITTDSEGFWGLFKEWILLLDILLLLDEGWWWSDTSSRLCLLSFWLK